MKKLILSALATLIMTACHTSRETVTASDIQLTAEQLYGYWLICSVDDINLTDMAYNLPYIPFNEISPANLFHPYVVFCEDGHLGANAGCNGMGGTYTYKDGKLHINDGGMTEMYCEGLMETENAVFSFLYDTISVKALTEDSVQLAKAERQMVLRRDTTGNIKQWN